MSDHLTRPKLRWPLDVKRQMHNGQELLVLSCLQGIAQKSLALHAAAGPILRMLTGEHEVQTIVTQVSAENLSAQTVHTLLKTLDEHLFLEGPVFDAANKRIRAEYHKQKVRPPALIGKFYSEAPDDLILEIDQYLASEQGLPAPLPSEDLICLKSPHIDYRRGHRGYGAAYRLLRDAPHELLLLIGTSHQYSEKLFHLTKQAFQTPLGTIPTDLGFVDELAAAYGEERSFYDEILHRTEHSLELQVPFIQRTAKSPAFVPVLVGSFYEYVSSGREPIGSERYETFVSSLAAIVKKYRAQGRTFGIVAGVDMAHMGQFFGDAEKLTEQDRTRIAERDAEYLQCIVRQDKRALFAHIAEDKDARRICGFPTMYMVLDLLERLQIKTTAKITGYEQAYDPKADCLVSFAAMGLYQNS